jgi:hypothetical protein
MILILYIFDVYRLLLLKTYYCKTTYILDVTIHCMKITIETIIYIVVLFDAISATVLAWSRYGTTLNNKFGLFTKHFPITRGWTTYYLLLVLWLGWAFVRLGVLG